MGWENVFSCEFAEFPAKVTQFYFPSSHHYGDIRELDGTKYCGTIDVLTGGFPCQPFSAAGKRRGTEDNRFLWPEMLRVIREIQPTWIVAENVRGIVSIEGGLVFERVCSEMEANGYEVQPFCIPACAVGAPHRRERLWFIGHAKHDGLTPSQDRQSSAKGIDGHSAGENEICEPSGSALSRTTPDSKNQHGERRECEGSSGGKPEKKIGNGNCDATNTESVRRGYGFTKNKKSPTTHEHTPSNKNGISGGWHETWLQAATRLCRVDDGLPRELDGITVPAWRRESLKAYGNAIVPALAFRIFQAIQEASDSLALPRNLLYSSVVSPFSSLWSPPHLSL